MNRRHKRTMTNIVTCLYRDRGNRWNISAKSIDSITRL